MVMPLGITLGDAAGIGPEIIVKLFAQGLPAPAVVYGDAGVLRRTAQLLGVNVDVREIAGPLARRTAADHGVAMSPAGTIPVLACRAALPDDLSPGRIDARAGRAAYDYVCAATDDALAGKLRAIVTAPLSKAAMQAAAIDYPGHTEILAARSGVHDYAMMLANQALRVLLVTIHVPLSAVPAAITNEAEARAIRLAHQACLNLGIVRPRVAVAGLNPHAGEGGKFGREDVDIIAPAIAAACAEGIVASGPWPGDTVFMRAREGEFDIVVAQYHDQGLIPIKYLGIDEGVNVTVGLPFVRTSVDHGTAFDIAGRGIADPGSLRAAVELALAMTPV